MLDRPARWLPSARELEAIARNLGVKGPAEPEGILAHLAGAITDAPEPTTVYAAGLLYKLVLMTRPYGGDSWAYALEAARVVLIANGHLAGRISQERCEKLRTDVESGAVTGAVEIGRRLLDLVGLWHRVAPLRRSVHDGAFGRLRSNTAIPARSPRHRLTVWSRPGDVPAKAPSAPRRPR